MLRYFIQLQYKGTGFSGWQRQPNAKTVQEFLDESLTMALREPVFTTGCGRTDAGVHAIDFYAHFDLKSPIEDEKLTLLRSNGILGNDVNISRFIKVPDDAHARFDAVSRSYIYQIIRKPNPFLSEYAWLIFNELNLEKMNEAAALLIGKKEFDCFCKAGGNNKTTICDVTEAYFETHGNLWRFHISADRFLRNMVRAIVGTLIEVGREKLSVAQFQHLLDTGTRSDAGTSAPAKALFLAHVAYPTEIIHQVTSKQIPELIPSNV